jgi:hypothetical protein
MDAAEYFIVALNLVLGLGLGWPLARRFAGVTGQHSRRVGMFALLLIVYFSECVAFTASMGTNVAGIGLAFVWGVVLARWLRGRAAESRRVPKLVLLFALYTSLPAATLLSVPVMVALAGWSILSSEDGYRFGIPAFVPWPGNTILGFCVAVTTVAVVCKVAITTTMVRLITRPTKRRFSLSL